MPQDRLNIAVFIDFDNIEIGVKSTLNENFDIGAILDAIKERGEVVTKIAYADWTRASEYSRHLTQHAIRLVQRNLTPGGDKNGADINLALDALEMAFTHPHINAYVIVGGDSDFLSLVEKLKQYDKKVFVVGGRAFTSIILQRNCHEFIAYENLSGRRSAAKGGRPAVAGAAPIAQAVPIVRRALKILADREVSPQTGLLKSTLLQLDSTFSERNYGASSFLDFAEKLAQAGVVTLNHAGRSVMVELNEGARPDVDVAGQTPQPLATLFTPGAPSPGTGYAGTPPPHSATPGAPSPGTGYAGTPPPHSATPGAPSPGSSFAGAPPAASAPPPSAPEPLQATESQATGVARASRILAAARNARWPMYLRNVKQILRQYRAGGSTGEPDAAGFDERRYGFGGLMDLLRALQRDGYVRLERDRRGGLRVFAGATLEKAAVSEAPLQQTGVADTQPGEPAEIPQAVDAVEVEVEQSEAEPVPRDTTAELLGRAKPKRSRVRTVGRAAPKKPTARRAPRAKRTVPDAADQSES